MRTVLPLSYHTAGILRWARDEDCQETMLQAMYNPLRNEVVICAGFFNSFRTDAGLYFALAHELAHAITPRVLALDDFRQTTHYRALGRLFGDSPPSCAEWNTRKERWFQPPQRISLAASGRPYGDLVSCFGDHEGLEPLYWMSREQVDMERIDQEALATTEEMFASFNNRELYDRLTYPETYLDPANYVLKYLNIENEWMRIGSPLNTAEMMAFPHVFIFSKEWECALKSSRANPLGFSERSRIGETAFRLSRNVIGQMFSRCGGECLTVDREEFAAERSADSGEVVADWLASRALLKYLEDVPSLETRWASLGETMAFFCPRSTTFSMTAGS